MKIRSPASRAMTLLACAAFASAAAIRICDPMLPAIAREFGTTNGQAASTITAFAIVYGLFQVLYGPLGDRYNKYRLVLLATVACIFSTTSAAVSPFLDWLIFSRAIAGATAAAIIPLSVAWIGDTVPYAERQATLARFLSGPILGLIGGQLLGGFVADILGWRWCFILLAIAYVVIGILLHRELKYNSLIQNQIITGLKPAGQPTFLSRFVDILRIHWVKMVLVIVFLESFAVFGSVAFIPVYLHTRFGLSLTAAGAIMAVFGLGGLSYAIIVERLVLMIGERGIALSGGIFLNAAFLMLLLSNSWWWGIPGSFLAGTGFYMLHNTLQTNATQMASFARGTAFGLFVASFFLGQSLGVFFGAAVFDHAGALWLFAVSSAALPLIACGFVFALRYRDRKQD